MDRRNRYRQVGAKLVQCRLQTPSRAVHHCNRQGTLMGSFDGCAAYFRSPVHQHSGLAGPCFAGNEYVLRHGYFF
jgi:hypothetical protein